MYGCYTHQFHQNFSRSNRQDNFLSSLKEQKKKISGPQRLSINIVQHQQCGWFFSFFFFISPFFPCISKHTFDPHLHTRSTCHLSFQQQLLFALPIQSSSIPRFLACSWILQESRSTFPFCSSEEWLFRVVRLGRGCL